MKKYLFLLLAATSTSAFAMPYVGFEYGITSIDHNYSTSYPSDNVSLTPDDSSYSFSGLIGYRFNDYGLELGYKSSESVDSRSQMLVSDRPGYAQTRKWDTELNAKQFTFKPVYFYYPFDELQIKIGLGLTYTQYQYNSSSEDEYESIFDDDVQSTIERSSGESNKDNALGGIVSVGIYYMQFRDIAYGFSASYQVDSVVTSTSFMFSTVLYF